MKKHKNDLKLEDGIGIFLIWKKEKKGKEGNGRRGEGRVGGTRRWKLIQEEVKNMEDRQVIEEYQSKGAKQI